MSGQELAASTVVRHPDNGEVTFLTVGTPLPAWAEGIVDEYLLCPVGTAAGLAEAARKAAVEARRRRRLEAQARAAGAEVDDADGPADNLVPDSAEDLSGDPGQGDVGGGSTGPLTPSEPPRAGRGSGLEAWQTYAESLGIEVPDGSGRDDVIDLVDKHNEK